MTLKFLALAAAGGVFGVNAVAIAADAYCLESDVQVETRALKVTRCVRNNGIDKIERAGSADGAEKTTLILGPKTFVFDGGELVASFETPDFAAFDALAKSGTPIGPALAAQWGYAATGESETIAGVACANYASVANGAICMAPDGAPLEIARAGYRERATLIRRDVAAVDAAFAKFEASVRASAH